MGSPLVSILMPCFNAAQTVAAAIGSCLAQTHRELEVIVVDDGSTDRSPSVVQGINDSRVRLIRQENRGASAARNVARAAAAGDYLQYLDADDLLSPRKLELQLALLERVRGEGVLISGEWARFYRDPAESRFIPEALWHTMEPVPWLTCSWNNNLMMHPAAWLVSRALSEASGTWNESLSLNDDGEYFTRVICASESVVFCPGAKVFYRSGTIGSLSSQKDDAAYRSLFRSFELSTGTLLARENSERTRRACANRYQTFFFEVYPKLPELVQEAEKRIADLGGADIKPEGGRLFQLVRSTLGLKAALRLQHERTRKAGAQP